MKALWAIQLDLLNEFGRVCKKYNLRYILEFGTLLGTIRHKGFIPWDDDLDVSMLREDYDKLIALIRYKSYHSPYEKEVKTLNAEFYENARNEFKVIDIDEFTKKRLLTFYHFPWTYRLFIRACDLFARLN